MTELERFFEEFKSNIVGNNQTYKSPYGDKKIIYADWIASGRLYKPIEIKLLEDFGPFVANTHTETNETGTRMTFAYQHAHKLIKKHVNANENDVIITAGFGMTTVINKLQRILGFKGCSDKTNNPCFKLNDEKPVVFISHMEHHSNHTSWLATHTDVIVIEPDENLLINPENLRRKLEEFKDRKFKIGSFSACSNVTGIITPYYELAEIMHEYGGICFVDFAASAPYVNINMHPANSMQKLDAIFFSPHKFLGGPGSSGVLIFDKSLYKREIPDHPGGGTVDWTNPWGDYKFIDDIEMREDGGTPGFLQAIKTALCIDLKNKMGVERIAAREKELVKTALSELRKIPQLNILANNVDDRIGCISFYVENIHYNLLVKLLSDRFGIQVRGGCACAGTYGHYLLKVSHEQSAAITSKINSGDFSEKPGWVRLSLHPTMSNNELFYIVEAIREIIENIDNWKKDYDYCSKANEYYHKTFPRKNGYIDKWFSLD
ncbi:MAG: aminotransferase class V-fold PLP-dependent enzyme [Bacteroidales bacterium]|nr:aminotransferase class V-fold PLP-dependent enzyme [Bacteroidales bacterium]